MTPYEIFSEFSPRLEKFGKVVLAGGAVRDCLMQRKPKDWDIFVLTGSIFPIEEIKKEVEISLQDFEKSQSVVEWHKSEPYLVENIRWNGSDVQILLSPYRNVEELFGSFDWNVCMFAFDGKEFILGESIANIGVGKELKLNKVTFPLSTLRRGFRFSERFKMKLKHSDMLILCRMVCEKFEMLGDKELQEDYS
jgi:hypothetical protein